MIPKISIIIPVYNVHEYIVRCSVSLFEQTMTDIEYIFVDDGSTDNSIQVMYNVLDKYPARKNNVKVLYNAQNLGVAKVRYRGFQSAKGEYVMYVDSDDWIHIDMCRQMYNIALDNDADVVECGFCKHDGTTICGTVLPSPMTICDDNRTKYLKCFVAGQKGAFVWNKLVKRDVYHPNELWPKENIMEDYVLSFSIYWYAKKIVTIDKCFYFYFYNAKSLTHNVDTKEKTMNLVENMRGNVKVVEDFVRSLNLYNDYIEEFTNIKYYIKNWSRHAVYSVKDCKCWLDCYPELNNPFIKNPYFSRRDRILAILIHLRLYPIVKYITSGCK
jgi:glycosyltransferase involved in cell wall biosynthesis